MANVEKRGARFRGRYRDAHGEKQTAKGPNGETSSTSKRAALKWAQDAESAIRAGTWDDPRRAGVLTFGQYFTHQWLPNRKMDISTKLGFITAYDSALAPTFADVPLNQITPATVQRWVVHLENDRGLAPVTIKNYFRKLSTILGATKGVSAMFDGLIRENPCRVPTKRIALPDIDPRDVQRYEVEEIEQLILAIDPWWQTLVLFATETGLRWGELLGLQVHDFGPEYADVWVRRTIVPCGRARIARLLERERALVKDGFYEKPKPKSKKPRHIKVSPEAAQAISQLVKERSLFPLDRVFGAQDSKLRGTVKRTESWPNGHPVSSGWFREQVWTKAHKATGIEFRKVHATRASHICWLIAGGADIATIQQRVGHEDLATTQVYMDAMADSDDRALEALRVTKDRGRALG